MARIEGFPYKSKSKMGEVMKKLEKFDMYSHSIYKGHEGAVWSITCSMDNSKIFSGSDDFSVIVWDAESHAQLHILQGHTNAVNALALTQNDEYLISGSWDNSIKVWDWKNSQEVLSLDGQGGVYCFAMSKDAKTLISGAGDGAARVWDLEQLMNVGVLDCAGSSVFGLALTSDELTVLTGGWDTQIRIWELATRTLISTLNANSGIIQCLLVTPDMKYIVFGTRTNIVKVWDYKAKKELLSVNSHNNWVRNLVSTQDSKYVVTCSADKTMRVINMPELVEEFNIEGHEGYIFGLYFTKDGRFLLSGASDKTLRRWEIGVQTRFKELIGHELGILCLSVTSDCKFVVSGSQDKNVKIWEIASGAEIACLVGHAGPIWTVCTSQNMKFIISGSDDKTIKIWDFSTQQEIFCFNQHNDSIFALDISINNSILVSSGKEKLIFVWDLENKILKKKLEGHTDTVFSVKLLKNCKSAISGSADYTVRLWDIENYSQLNIIKTNCGMIESICLNPKESILAVADRNNLIHIWDFARNEKIGILKGHKSWVKSVVFGTNTLLASCSLDGSIKIWDCKQKIQVKTLKNRSGGVRCVGFNKECTWIVSGSDNNSLQVWDIFNVKDLETNDCESALDSFIFLTKLKNKIIPSRLMINQALSSLRVNLAHVYCYLDEDVLLQKVLDLGIQIYRDAEGNSPLCYALERKSTKCIDAFLKHLVYLSHCSTEDFLNSCQAIKKDFFKLLKFPTPAIHNFLDSILHPVNEINLPKFGYPKNTLPMVKFTEQDKIIPEIYLFNDNAAKALQPICFKKLPFKICLEPGSAASLKFLKLICVNQNLEISQTELVKTVILSKWEISQKYFILYSLLLWLNLALMLVLVLGTSDNVILSVFLGTNFLFFVFEALKIYSLALGSYLKLSAGIEILRLILCFLWGYFKLINASHEKVTWLLIIFNFLHGLSVFKAFDHTRPYVSLIYNTLKDSFGFIILYIYSSLALIMLLKSTEISSSLLQSPYELFTSTPINNPLDYLYFPLASIINIIFMLNLLITVISDAHDKFVFNNSDNGSFVKSGIIFEIESAMFWKKNFKKQTYIQVCEKYLKKSDINHWKGRQKAVTDVVQVMHLENNSGFSGIQTSLKDLTLLRLCGDRVLQRLSNIPVK